MIASHSFVNYPPLALSSPATPEVGWSSHNGVITIVKGMIVTGVKENWRSMGGWSGWSGADITVGRGIRGWAGILEEGSGILRRAS
ncbi:hypothetical protein Tco_0205608 [Tanacetum coccineum]